MFNTSGPPEDTHKKPTLWDISTLIQVLQKLVVKFRQDNPSLCLDEETLLLNASTVWQIKSICTDVGRDLKDMQGTCSYYVDSSSRFEYSNIGLLNFLCNELFKVPYNQTDKNSRREAAIMKDIKELFKEYMIEFGKWHIFDCQEIWKQIQRDLKLYGNVDAILTWQCKSEPRRNILQERIAFRVGIEGIFNNPNLDDTQMLWEIQRFNEDTHKEPSTKKREEIFSSFIKKLDRIQKDELST